MSLTHRNPSTLKNSTPAFHAIAAPTNLFSCVRTPGLICVAILMVAAVVMSSSNTLGAEESQQWRRTKDGWVDLTSELRLSQPPPFEYSNSIWSSIWPAAATLCIGLGAYWLLTCDPVGDSQEKLEKISANPLGRLIRQTSNFGPDLTSNGNDTLEPIPVRIVDQTQATPHQ